MSKVKTIQRIEEIPELASQKEELNEVTRIFPLRTNSYYLSLIDWSNPEDPLRRLVIPDTDESIDGGSLDPSNESKYTVIQGLEHKYSDTVIALISGICESYCRYCFRKRFFLENQDQNGKKHTIDDWAAAEAYIREHKEIIDVLLSGGDPFMLPTQQLEEIVAKVSEIEHVQFIRIGTKVTAFNPYRVLDNKRLNKMLLKYADKKAICIMNHFDHPNELTQESAAALKKLRKTGVQLYSQTPITRGINDNIVVLKNLLNELTRNGVTPYYFFIMRPSVGNSAYAVPIDKAYALFSSARSKCRGPAQTSRLVMSHETGKIEISGLTETEIHMRYHRAADPANYGLTRTFSRNYTATWFDDFTQPPVVQKENVLDSCKLDFNNPQSLQLVPYSPEHQQSLLVN